jgi:hypothetical protein
VQFEGLHPLYRRLVRGAESTKYYTVPSYFMALKVEVTK